MALVEVAMFHDPVSAELALDHLRSEGINGVLFGTGLASLGLGTMAPVRLMVDEDDRAQAEALLNAAEGGARSA